MADRSVVVRFSAVFTDWSAAFSRAGASLRDLDSKVEESQKRHRQGFESIMEGAGGAAAALGLFVGASIVAYARFDQEMSRVKAATHASAGEMDQLREAALDAGRTTVFSATEAAAAITELAKAGLKTSDILGGGLKGALDLASAGELGVAEAAETAASAMVMFGLKGSAVPHVADLLSAAAGKAQGSVHDMGMALNQAGLVSAQMGLSIEETTGTLAMFANAGLIGSDAGTSLKTALLRLAAPTKESSELMKTLGINAYDAAGEFVGMEKFAGNLRSSLQKLTPEQRDSALATIFGADAIRAASILYENGAEGVRRWNKMVNDSGYASETAAAKLDNLMGDFEKLKGAIETGLIESGSAANGVLRGLTQSATGTVEVLTGMPGPMQAIVTVAALLTAGALAAAVAYGTLAPKVREAQAALATMGPTAQRAATAMMAVGKYTGGAIAVIAGLQVAGQIVDAFWAGQKPADIDKLTASIEKYASASGKAGDISKQWKTMAYDLGRLDSSNFTKVTDGIAEGIEKITTLGDNFDESVTNAKRRIDEWDKALANSVRSGNAKDAAAAFEDIARAAAKEGVSRKELNKGFDDYNTALKEAASAADMEGQAKERNAARTDLMSQSFQEAIQSAEQLKSTFDSLNGVAITTDQAIIAAERSAAQLRETFQGGADAIDLHTKKGYENSAAVIDLTEKARDAAAAKYEETASVEQANEVYNYYIDQLRRAGRDAGMTEDQIQYLIDRYGQMPKYKDTKVEAKGTEESKSRIGGVVGELARLPSHKTVTISVSRIGSAAGSLAAGIGKADGGIVHFAGGGMYESHLAQIAPAGTWRVWAEPETGGEAYIPLSPMKRARSEQVLSTVAAGFGGAYVKPQASMSRSYAAPSAGHQCQDLRPAFAALERAVRESVPSIRIGDETIARASRRGERKLGKR